LTYEAGSGPLPDPGTILGVGEDGQRAEVIFVAPGGSVAAENSPVPTTVVSITTSRDLDELNPMVEQIEAGDVSTEMHVGDVVVAVSSGS
jgi:hypothetical protein